MSDLRRETQLSGLNVPRYSSLWDTRVPEIGAASPLVSVEFFLTILLGNEPQGVSGCPELNLFCWGGATLVQFFGWLQDFRGAAENNFLNSVLF